jgi:hypothetical protein
LDGYLKRRGTRVTKRHDEVPDALTGAATPPPRIMASKAPPEKLERGKTTPP